PRAPQAAARGGVRGVPHPARAARAARLDALRRRTADARDRARHDERPALAAARRAVARHRADPDPADLRRRSSDRRVRHCRASGGAERARSAARRDQRVRAANRRARSDRRPARARSLPRSECRVSWRVGIDIGGTFTDLVALADDGRLIRHKVASTPQAPEDGLLDALRALLSEMAPHEIALVAHASTIATNALLGQMHLELPRVAFVTTEGFRDVLEIGRQNRSVLYDLDVRRPKPLARRED